MTKLIVTWLQDGVDPGWFYANAVGSVRSSKSYGRPGGWWFLPAWLPDTEEHDVGPFRSKALAFNEAERLTIDHRPSIQAEGTSGIRGNGFDLYQTRPDEILRRPTECEIATAWKPALEVF